jgi:hypothetical protein
MNKHYQQRLLLEAALIGPNDDVYLNRLGIKFRVGQCIRQERVQMNTYHQRIPQLTEALI